MFRQINVIPGHDIDRVNLGFLAISCRIDNPTGQWFYLDATQQYIPPYTLGMVVTFDTGTEVAIVRSSTPAGLISAPRVGQQAFFSFIDTQAFQNQPKAPTSTSAPMARGGGGQAPGESSGFSGNDSSNPAGVDSGAQSAIPATQPDASRWPTDIARGPTSPNPMGNGAGGNVPPQADLTTDATPQVPSGGVGGTPTASPTLLQHATIGANGLLIHPSDEQGRVTWGDSFEDGIIKWDATAGAPASSALYAQNGAKSLQLADGDIATHRHTLSAFRRGDIGCEASFMELNGPNGVGYYRLVFRVSTSCGQQQFGVENRDGALYYLSAAGTWVALPFQNEVDQNGNPVSGDNLGDVSNYKTMFNPIKIVVHMDDDPAKIVYSHVVINGAVINMASAPGYENVSSVPTSNWFGVKPFVEIELSQLTTPNDVFVDDVLLTDNEPDNVPSTHVCVFVD